MSSNNDRWYEDKWTRNFYKDSQVLKNRLNITSQEKLARAEIQIVAFKSQILDKVMNLSYGDRFSVDRLKAIHHFLFSDIYEWAGESRTVNMKKEEAILNWNSVEYEDKNRIEPSMQNVMKRINSPSWKSENIDKETKLLGLGHLLCEMWRIHMFREGNTRACVAFCMEFAESVGLHLDREYFRENSSHLRNCIVLYTQGKTASMETFLHKAYIDRGPSEEEISYEFMKTFSIKDLGRYVDEWIEKKTEDPEIRNWLIVNKRDIMSSLMSGNYEGIDDVEKAFSDFTDSMISEGEQGDGELEHE